MSDLAQQSADIRRKSYCGRLTNGEECFTSLRSEQAAVLFAYIQQLQSGVPDLRQDLAASLASEQRAQAALEERERIIAERNLQIQGLRDACAEYEKQVAAAIFRGDEQHDIVARIWVQLGSPTYSELQGRSIHDLVDNLKFTESAYVKLEYQAGNQQRQILNLKNRITELEAYKPESTFVFGNFRNGVDTQGLQISLTSRGLTIRIDPETLKSATEQCPDLWNPELDRYTARVTDPMEWLNSVMQKLIEMQESGRTLLTDMLDKAIVKAVNDGEEGCDA